MQEILDPMREAIEKMPFLISVPLMAGFIAFCRPNTDGTGVVWRRRLNQSVMASFVALGGLYATEAMGVKPEYAMFFGIFVGVMGWEYVKTNIELIIKKLIDVKIK